MDAYLSPEMKSTGEVMGYDRELHRALYQALVASGMKLLNYGTVIVTIADEERRNRCTSFELALGTLAQWARELDNTIGGINK